MTVGWGRPFDEPIDIAGPKLATLLDAGGYIAALPKKEHDAPEWQAAMEVLLLVEEGGGPHDVCPASCGHWHFVPEFTPEGKGAALGPALKRDQ